MLYLPPMKVSTYAWLIVIALFIFVGSFGITSLAMPSNADGTMSSCPLSGTSALCHMSPIDHAYTLQTMLTAVPSFSLFTLFTLFLISLSFVFVAPLLWAIVTVFFKSIIGSPPVADRIIPRHSLQEAYASGVLNSKAF